MIIAKVTSPGIDDRFFRLEPGTHIVGSSFNCDVVLLDDLVQPHHLTLHVTQTTVEVELAEGATARFKHFLYGRQSDSKSGDRIAWHLGDKLTIAELSVELQGVTAESVGVVPVAAKTSRRRGKLGLFSATVCLLAGLLLTNLPFIGNNVDQPAAADASDADKTITRSVTVKRPLNAESISKQLHILGLKPEKLIFRDGKWTGSLRVADETERRKLDEKLSTLTVHFEAEVHVDEQLKKAATITLSNLPGDIEIRSLKNGVLLLSTLEDEARSRTVQTLLNDVPGLDDVRFEVAFDANLDRIQNAVAAVWSGKFPYVVLTDDTIVRPGNNLNISTKLVDIYAEFFLIDMDDTQQRIYFR
jgi:type III secretion system YscD/HrpQ family protein